MLHEPRIANKRKTPWKVVSTSRQQVSQAQKCALLPEALVPRKVLLSREGLPEAKIAGQLQRLQVIVTGIKRKLMVAIGGKCPMVEIIAANKINIIGKD